MDKATAQNNGSVNDYVASLGDEQTAKDSLVLIEMMQRISGHEPKLWNVGTIGFDTYRYKYDSRREGDAHVADVADPVVAGATTTSTTAGAKATAMLLAFIQEEVGLPFTSWTAWRATLNCWPN